MRAAYEGRTDVVKMLHECGVNYEVKVSCQYHSVQLFKYQSDLTKVM